MNTLLKRFQSLVFVVVSATIIAHAQGQDTLKDHAVLPESYLRESVVNPIMPSFPEEAARKNISGLIRIRIEISADGQVLKIKVKPGTNLLLARAVFDAAKEWQFRPFHGAEGAIPSIGRLSFQFVLLEDGSRVQFYNPPLDAPDRERLGYCNSFQDSAEWKKWEEIPFQKKKE